MNNLRIDSNKAQLINKSYGVLQYLPVYLLYLVNLVRSHNLIIADPNYKIDRCVSGSFNIINLMKSNRLKQELLFLPFFI
jgi:hypothetical protein